MILRFRSGSVTPFKAGQKLLDPIQDPEIEMQLRGKHFLDLVTLACPQHAVIDEDTGQLVADGTVSERCRHRGIHAAAQGTNDALLARPVPGSA